MTHTEAPIALRASKIRCCSLKKALASQRAKSWGADQRVQHLGTRFVPQ